MTIHQVLPRLKTSTWIAKGTSFAKETSRPPSTKVDGELLNGMIERALFEGPCKCCGDPDHGLFTRISGKGGVPRITLACATSESEDWEKCLKTGLGTMRFKASFEKFSEANDNRIDRLQIAMRQFIKNGEGKHMHYLELIDFDSDLHRYRKQMGSQGRFKRCSSRTDEEETIQDSDEESRC